MKDKARLFLTVLIAKIMELTGFVLFVLSVGAVCNMAVWAFHFYVYPIFAEIYLGNNTVMPALGSLSFFLHILCIVVVLLEIIGIAIFYWWEMFVGMLVNLFGSNLDMYYIGHFLFIIVSCFFGGLFVGILFFRWIKANIENFKELQYQKKRRKTLDK